MSFVNPPYKNKAVGVAANLCCLGHHLGWLLRRSFGGEVKGRRRATRQSLATYGASFMEFLSHCTVLGHAKLFPFFRAHGSNFGVMQVVFLHQKTASANEIKATGNNRVRDDVFGTESQGSFSLLQLSSLTFQVSAWWLLLLLLLGCEEVI